MNYRMVGKYLAYFLFVLGLFLFPCAFVGVFYKEMRPALSLLATAGISLVLGLLLYLPSRRENSAFYLRDGFVVAGLGWVLLSAIGALPFVISGEIPFFPDAFFESASGFTTTGASILENVEALSHAMLFWRSFTHWLGGIGVLAFVLLVVHNRKTAGFTMNLLRAESTGPKIGKPLPKTRQSVQILFIIYIALSLCNLVFLLLGGMPVFDALCIMFGTAGTGGFSIKNSSMGEYSLYIQNITTLFMLLFGVNLTLYYFLAKRNFKAVFLDEELRFYLGTFLFFSLAITFILYFSGKYSFTESLQNSSFTTSSILTTTGYGTANFDLWPQACRVLILILMLCGGMAGSTAGGVKAVRLLILFRTAQAGLRRLIRPHTIRPTRVNQIVLEKAVVNSVFLYFTFYIFIAILTFLLLAFENIPLETTLSATLSCLNNIGPGLGFVGPAANYHLFSGPAKMLLSFVMLVGRLEIFPILFLFFPSTWRRR